MDRNGTTGRKEHTPEPPIVVNATNIGSMLDGIGTFGLNLLKELARIPTPRHFVVYVNTTARTHLAEVALPSNVTLVWVSSRMSPDLGFRGHLVRLAFANLLGIRHRRSLLFGISQLEAVFFRSRQILTVHDLIPLMFKQCHRKQHFYYKYLLRFALRKALAIVAPSVHTKELLEQHYSLSPAKITVVHNGVHYDGEEPPISDKEQVIVYVGRLVRMKNMKGVLAAFALLQDEIDHKLVIVGSGASGNAFEPGVLRRYHLASNRVIFRGYVPTAEMRALLKRASLLVFPSFYEGFGFPPLEAMSCGCPVVVSRVASLPEVCGDAAYYVDPHNVKSIAHGMRTVLSDSELRHRLITHGYRRARMFRWDRTANAYMRVINEHAFSPEGVSVSEELHPAIGGT